MCSSEAYEGGAHPSEKSGETKTTLNCLNLPRYTQRDTWKPPIILCHMDMETWYPILKPRTSKIPRTFPL